MSIGLQLLLCVTYTLFHTIIDYYCTLSTILILLYYTELKYIHHEQTVNLLSSKLIYNIIYIYPYPCILPLPQPTRVQDLSAVKVTSQSQADRVNRNAYRYIVVTLVLFICK